MALSVFVPGTCSAQPRTLSVDLPGGLTLPLGNTARVSGTGTAFGFGVLHRLGSRVHLTTDFQLSDYRDDTREFGPPGTTTDLDMWRATVGLMVRVYGDSPGWQLNARGGLGLAGIGSGPLPPGSQEPTESANDGLNEDVIALTGGVELSRGLGSRFVPFLRVQVDAYSLGEELLGLAILNEAVPASGWLVGVPVQIGVRYEF